MVFSEDSPAFSTRLPKTMGNLGISRRKRFVILLIIFIATFLTYSWYSRSNFSHQIPIVELPDDVPDDTPPTKAAPPKQDFVEKLRQSVVKKPPPPTVTVNPTMYEKFLKMFHIHHDRPAEDQELLNSGPTEFPLAHTTKFDWESIPSGPTANTKFDWESIPSGPTANTKFDWKSIPSGPTANTKFDWESIPSGPTELDESVTVEAPKLQSSTEYHNDDSIIQNPSTKWSKNPSLILDTQGCKVPKFDPFDPTVKDLYEKKDPYQCPGPPLFMRPQPDGSIALNAGVLLQHYKTKPEGLTCLYRNVTRLHESAGGTRENNYEEGSTQPLLFGVPLHSDYVIVDCRMGRKTFEQYFALARLKDEVEKERDKITPPEPKLNVILAGVDSVSKLNFLRHFPRTREFLTRNMSAFEMNGYTKVGDNTFPNLVPLLTGHFIEHYWNETIRDTYTFDNIDHIWKYYAKRGYRTFYAEDSPYTGTFNYLKRGFYDPPTDYYQRPITMAMENSKLRKKSKTHCLHSQIETDFVYDYLRDFIKAMESRPYIAFAMVSTMTHDYLNSAGWADEPTVRLLEDLSKMGAFNNSMLVIFSDHGLRFGQIRETYIGKFEERMPFMYIHFPKWFLDKYPELAQNLRTNQERLMTLFDVHATMVNLVEIGRTVNRREMPDITLGSSLLQELAENRTCEEANILDHWCPCQTFTVVPHDDKLTVRATQTVVDDINTKLTEFGGVCEILETDTVIDARVGQASDLVMRFVKHQNDVVNRTVLLGNKVDTFADYSITLRTKPGGAVFESTVRYNLKDDSNSVLGISRINMYKNQSWCIDSQKMKIFCYCKTQQTNS